MLLGKPFWRLRIYVDFRAGSLYVQAACTKTLRTWLLPGFSFKLLYIIPAANQIPDGFIFNAWHIDAGQLSGTKQSYQVDGITTVGFDPVATSFGDH